MVRLTTPGTKVPGRLLEEPSAVTFQVAASLLAGAEEQLALAAVRHRATPIEG